MPDHPAETVLHIHLLGEFRLVYGDTPITTISADRPQTLLTYLLLHRDAPQPRHHLAFLLWPDSTETQARTNLRNLLHTLRRTLPAADSYLAIDHLTIQWRGDSPYTLDVADFERAAAAGLAALAAGEVHSAWQALENAAALYQGDLLPACYDDWIVPLREDLRQRFLLVLDQLSELLEGLGEHRAALRHAQRLVREDPLRESSHVALMRAYARAGDRAGVTRAYQACVQVLARELEVEPAPATQAQYRYWLQHVAVDLPATSPALAPALSQVAGPRPELPSVAHFVGRDEEIAALAALLDHADCRLVTVVGPGGVGKTSLAICLAARIKPRFTGGVVVVQLASVAGPETLPSAIAAALRVPLPGLEPPDRELVAALAGQDLLLVLDNMEHLLAGVDLVAALLEQAPGVKLLVTSRERLNLQEEWLFDLQGLRLPQPNDPALPSNPAVELFVYHARRALRDFALDAETQAAVVEICRLVDGMPLAIELAASWVRVLPCPEIAQEIRRNMAFLATTARNVPERHRSLQTTFDHSWRLLREDERAALRRLAVFRGDFGRAAAAEVAGAELPMLAQLVDKSLVRGRGAGRFDLHELIRQYALLQLAADPAEEHATRDRHSRFYMRFLIERAPELFGPHQPETLAALGQRFDNLRAAWEWAISQRAIGEIAAGARVFSLYIDMSHRYTEGIDLFRQASEMLASTAARSHADDLLARLRVQVGLGICLLRRTHLRAARTLFEEVIEQTRECPSPLPAALYQAKGDAIYYLGLTQLAAGDYAAAECSLEQGLAVVAAQIGDGVDLHRAMQQAMLAVIHLVCGDYDRALVLGEEALAALRTVGHSLSQRWARCTIAYARWRVTEEPDISISELREVAAICEADGDTFNAATVNYFLGLLYLDQGDHRAAQSCLTRSMEGFRQVGVAWNVARGLRALGHACLAAGDHAAAEHWLRQCLALTEESELASHASDALVGLAELAWAGGASDRAWRLLLAALARPAGDRAMQERAAYLLAALAPLQAPAEAHAAQQRLATRWAWFVRSARPAEEKQ